MAKEPKHITVLLVEDHTVVRKGIRRLLEDDPRVRVVGEANNGRDALTLAQRIKPDVAVVDVGLPGLNGIELTHQLRSASPATAVLILSMYGDPAYVRRALQAGAKAYLLKDDEDQDLLKAVLAVYGGGSYFSPTVSKVVLDGFLAAPGDEIDDELSLLSDREREVLQLVAEGKSSKEIAQLLHLSVSTVESHRKHIMEKLDLHNTAAVVRFAIRKGLVQ
ncbi:MAG: response regulator transcription factor [Candidatus Binatia bacterium]|nr:response regulator transcription factor [Candidatus Binatia bacterium]